MSIDGQWSDQRLRRLLFCCTMQSARGKHLTQRRLHLYRFYTGSPENSPFAGNSPFKGAMHGLPCPDAILSAVRSGHRCPGSQQMLTDNGWFVHFFDERPVDMCRNRCSQITGGIRPKHQYVNFNFFSEKSEIRGRLLLKNHC
jgi:hypothetical protein